MAKKLILSDIIVKFKDKDVLVLYEVKPFDQVNEKVNKIKFKSAILLENKLNYKFKIITQKFLKDELSKDYIKEDPNLEIMINSLGLKVDEIAFIEKKTGGKFIPKDEVEVYEKWKAEININKIRMELGFFIDEIDAAKAYNIAALKYHGKFACLNEIIEKESK